MLACGWQGGVGKSVHMHNGLYHHTITHRRQAWCSLKPWVQHVHNGLYHDTITSSHNHSQEAGLVLAEALSAAEVDLGLYHHTITSSHNHSQEAGLVLAEALGAAEADLPAGHQLAGLVLAGQGSIAYATQVAVLAVSWLFLLCNVFCMLAINKSENKHGSLPSLSWRLGSIFL